MTSDPLVVHGIIVILLATKILKRVFTNNKSFKNYDTDNINRESTNHFISGA